MAAILVIGLLGTVTSARCEAPTAPERRVLVEIGSDRITVADFQLYLRQANPLIDLAKLPPGEQQARLDDFIGKKLFALAGREAGLDQSPEVRARIEFLVDSVLAQAFKDRLLSEIEVSGEELEGYYREHRERFRLPERAFLEHYLYRHRDKAARSRGQLRDGASFDQLAEEKGRDPGVLLVERGWFTPDLLIPEVAQAAFRVAAGEVSEVIDSSYGHHVLRVQEQVASRIQDFSAARPEIAEMVRQSKAARAFQEALEEARRHNKVSVHPDRLQLQGR